MSPATGIQKLEQLVAGVAQQGRAAVAEITAALAAIRTAATAAGQEGLGKACRSAEEHLPQLAKDDAVWSAHAARVQDHLMRLVEFGKAVAAAPAGASTAAIVPPPPLVLPDADEDKHLLETVAMFVTHGISAVAELEEDILGLEGSQQNSETMGGIRRIVHTLKAEFGVLNIGGAQKLCHQAEAAIDACVGQQQTMPVDVLLECADTLKQFLDRLSRDARSAFPDVAPLLEKLGQLERVSSQRVELTVGGEFADSLPEFVTEARSHLAEAESAMLCVSGNPGDLDQINLTFRAFHTIKGVAGFLNLTAIVELAHVTETLLDESRSQRLTLCQQDIDLILAAGDMINQMINALEGQPAPMQHTLSALTGKLQQAAVRSDRPGTADDAEGEGEPPAARPAPAAAAGPAAPAPGKPEAAKPEAAKPAGAPPSPPSKAPPGKPAAVAVGDGDHGEVKTAKVERTVKVSTTRLDMLVDMVGELVIAQSMVLQDPSIQRLDGQSLARNIGQVGKITRDLQEAAMSLRMVTVKATFQKMARLVRDVAGKAGKRVALTIQGEETELDRNVVEQISDPLVHMIRNAVDHGIEPPDDRRQKGKHSEGRMLLRAYHQGGSIVIEIQDDGRGIDKERVVRKAVDKGLLAAGTEARELSDAEAFNIIFLPGFSTAEKVTDISGRGVGMDVVRRNIEALRGKIEIESRLGEGTTFRMRLPLTLAIIDGMVVRVGRERYVVPTLSIEQSFRPASADVHYVVDRGECVRVRGAVLPIHRLKQVFVQQDGLDDLSSGILIVVEVDGERSCLFVDEILGQQQVVIKSLGMQGGRVTGVSGGAIMSDGRIALILDVGSLVNSAVGV